jgi:hypothetical protein
MKFHFNKGEIYVSTNELKGFIVDTYNVDKGTVNVSPFDIAGLVYDTSKPWWEVPHFEISNQTIDDKYFIPKVLPSWIPDSVKHLASKLNVNSKLIIEG